MAVLLSPLLVAAADASGQGSRIVAQPPSLRLAEGTHATLRITTSGETPAMSASVGRIEGLHEISPGVFEADYVPPDTLDPQLAFITALWPTGFGWTTIPLSGVRDVSVKARPGTPVSVTIESDVFGPVVASPASEALIRVAVPPGVHFAMASLRRHSFELIDLRVDDPAQVHLLLDHAKVEATATGEVIVRALVVDDHGRPRSGARVVFRASEGTLAPPTETEPGVYEAHWQLAPGEVRQARVTARLSGRPAATAAAAMLDRAPGPPQEIALELDRNTLVAGESDALKLVARLTDATGHLTDSAATLSTNVGNIVSWERAGRGMYRGEVEVPPRRTAAALEIKVTTAGSVSVNRSIPLVPGSAKELRVESASELYADGRPRDLQISLVDNSGNRVEMGDTPTVSASRGALGSPVRYATGSYRVAYRAPPSGSDFRDVITARMGRWESQGEFHVRARTGTIVVAPKGGFAIGSGSLASGTGGAEIGVWMPYLHSSFGFLFEVQYLGFARTDTLVGAGQTIVVKTSAGFTSFMASLAYRHPLLKGMLRFDAGAGPVLVTSSISTAGQQNLSGSGFTAAGAAGLSWEYPWGPGAPFGEVKLTYQADSGQGNLRGSLEVFSFQVGYRYNLY